MEEAAELLEDGEGFFVLFCFFKLSSLPYKSVGQRTSGHISQIHNSEF